MQQPFVHLRVHTAYSLSEGAVRLPALIEQCKAHHLPAMAVTDSNNLFGALEFSLAAAKAGIQPILGCVLNIAPPFPEVERQPHASRQMPDKLVCLVQSEQGYKHLMDIVSESFLDPSDEPGPLLTYERLEGRTDGLIALAANHEGSVGKLLLQGRKDKAHKALHILQQLFPGRLYIELQRHGLETQKAIEAPLVNMAVEYSLPLVATNDVYFPDKEMYNAHDALLCIAGGRYVDEPERRRLTAHHYLKSQEEMRELFADIPEAIENTAHIARRCAYISPARKPILPRFAEGEARQEEEAFVKVAKEGLQWRLDTFVFQKDMDEAQKAETAKPYWERLQFELDVIIRMEFPGYFLIVSDFIRWAKEHDIPVGPGRGSGAGSVVAWAMRITDLDPLRFGLLFERFLNPDRVSMPDFDVDFCQERRDEVIRYVQQKYGRDRVAQIITFGKLQARAVLRDVGRVLQMPYGQVDKICKLVPNNPANPVTLGEAIELEPLLKRNIQQEETVKRLVDIALKLEGLYRHSSTHAAGVVIADRPLQELVALYRDPKSDMPVVQFSMKYAETAGLVKFDFLGLKTLTVLSSACRFVQENTGREIELLKLPLDDRPTYDMLGRGDAIGVFQLESAGMRDTLRKLKPDTLEDIIALVSLYRPGPMDNIPTYVARKHGREKPQYPHEMLRSILEETFGVIIYQEQVMQIAQEMAGYSLAQADLLRRAMGKKIQAEMDAQREIFIDGAVKKGVDKPTAKEVFELMNKFASYGFNKSHAAAYALIAFQTAYLKANYPAEFFTALMCLDNGNTDKLDIFRQDALSQNIDVLPPDVNRSQANFTTEKLSSLSHENLLGERAGGEDAAGSEISDKPSQTSPHPNPLPQGEGANLAIRYALGAIKNVGMQAMEVLVKEREENGPFKDMFDLAGRLDQRVLNKRQLEYLVKAGAFDSLCSNRHQLIESLDMLMAYATDAANQRDSNQVNLFAMGGEEEVGVPRPTLPEVDDWPASEKLQYEFEAIGFYLGAHPLEAYEAACESLHVTWCSQLEQKLGTKYGSVAVAGVVLGRKSKVSPKGKFAFISLSDPTGSYEVSVFDETLLTERWDDLEEGNLLVIHADGKKDESGPRLIAREIKSLNDALSARPAHRIPDMHMTLQSGIDLSGLKTLLGEHDPEGQPNLSLTLLREKEAVDIRLPGRYRLTPQVVQQLQEFKGVEGMKEASQ